VTIERLPSLSADAQRRLATMDITNVTFVVGDGSLGSPGHAPFDRILSAAASPSVPAPWVSQLSEGGVIVLPVGDLHEQVLTRVTRVGGVIETEVLGGCRFVPLVGLHGFKI
jgi:protein-L-isoaspartate(D-aspartate) O-methyltransferase